MHRLMREEHGGDGKKENRFAAVRSIEARQKLLLNQSENREGEAVEYRDRGEKSQHKEDVKTFRQVAFEKGAEIVEGENELFYDIFSEISHSRKIEENQQKSEEGGEEQ